MAKRDEYRRIIRRAHLFKEFTDEEIPQWFIQFHQLVRVAKYLGVSAPELYRMPRSWLDLGALALAVEDDFAEYYRQNSSTK